MSEKLKFKAVPALSFTLPFALKEDDLLRWLNELTRSESKNACWQILGLLQALLKIELSCKTRMSFLKLLREYLQQFISNLRGNCWEASFPLTDEEVLYSEMAIWNYLLLAENFFIASQDGITKGEVVIASCYALKVLGLAQLHIAAVYSTPCTGFWALAYQIFAAAEKRKLLQMPPTDPRLKNLTVNTFFARIVIFHVCDTSQFRPRDMRTIFDFLDKVCVDLPITDISTRTYDIFMLDLKTDIAPFNAKDQRDLSSDLTRYFSPRIVANAIEDLLESGTLWSGTLKSINNTLFNRVINTLELKQKRLFERKPESRSLLGVIGFEDIIVFLHKATKKKWTPVKKTVQPVKTKETSGLALVFDIAPEPSMNPGKLDEWTLMGETQDFNLKEKLIDAPKKEIWDKQLKINQVLDKKISLKKIHVLDSSANGYSVYWDEIDTKTKIGDIFGIISEDKRRLEIAIIRRIFMSEDHKFRLGAQIIGFESELVFITQQPEDDYGLWAIFVPGISLLEEADSLIYNTGCLKMGYRFYLHRQEKVIATELSQEIHSDTAISHAELYYPAPRLKANYEH